MASGYAVCATLRQALTLWRDGKENKTNSRPGKWNEWNRNKRNREARKGNKGNTFRSDRGSGRKRGSREGKRDIHGDREEAAMKWTLVAQGV